MVELIAAVAASAITIAAMAAGSGVKRANEGREALVRLAVGMESISNKLEQLHVDFRSDRKEIFSRLSGLETRVAKVEAHNDT